MTAPPLPADPISGSVCSNHLVSLAPLQASGQASLSPDLGAGIIHMALTELQTACRNAFNEVTIRKADDLFACAAKSGRFYDLVPKGGELVHATLRVRYVESPIPRAVKLAPPHTLIFENPQDAARLLPLLTQRGFSTVWGRRR